MSLSMIALGSKVILREGPLRAERGMAAMLDFPICPSDALTALDTLFTLPMPTEADLTVCVPRLPCPLVSGWVQPVVSPGRRSEEGGDWDLSIYSPVPSLWGCLELPVLHDCLLTCSLIFSLPFEYKKRVLFLAKTNIRWSVIFEFQINYLLNMFHAIVRTILKLRYYSLLTWNSNLAGHPVFYLAILS